jgi:hypothetical protein
MMGVVAGCSFRESCLIARVVVLPKREDLQGLSLFLGEFRLFRSSTKVPHDQYLVGVVLGCIVSLDTIIRAFTSDNPNVPE